MIGYALALLAAIVAPPPTAGIAEIKTFVLAFMSDKPASELPFASPKLSVRLGGQLIRPDIRENMRSVRAAVAKCRLIRVDSPTRFDNGDDWYMVALKCPGDETDAAKRLAMSVVVDDSGIVVVNLMIGAPPQVGVQ